MPAVAALPMFWGAVGATAGAGASLFGAHEQSNAAQSAVNAQTQAANYAADLQAKAAAQALQFQQQQSALDQANFLKTQNANYGQFQTASNENYGQYAAGAQTDYDRWALHQNNMGYLGQLLGLPARQLPAANIAAPPVYGANPFATSGSGSASSGAPTQSIMDALTKNYKTLGYSPTGPGTGPTDIAYMADAINKTGGLTADNQGYWLGPNGRIAQELAKAGTAKG
jgi:hypothetical protein